MQHVDILNPNLVPIGYMKDRRQPIYRQDQWIAFNDKLYLQTNSTPVQLPPPHPIDRLTREDAVRFNRLGLRMHWLRPDSPYTAYLTPHADFSNPVFSCLDVDFHKVMCGNDRDGYSIHPQVVEDWKFLEKRLRTTLLVMTREAGLIYQGCPIRFWPFPSSARYDISWNTPFDLLVALWIGRELFTMLMAELAFAHEAILVKDQFKQASKMDYPWQSHVVTKVNSHTGIYGSAPHPNLISYDWLTELLKTQASVTNPSVQRVGGVVDVSLEEFQDSIAVLLRSKIVPLLLHWPSSDCRSIILPEKIRPLRPLDSSHVHCISTPENIVPPYLIDFGESEDSLLLLALYWPESEHLRLDSSQIDSPPDGPHHTLFFPDGPRYYPIDLPEPSAERTSFPTRTAPHGLLQRPGEKPEEFFARIQQLAEAAQASETPEQAQSRRQREQHHAKGACPGRGGCKVFWWDTDAEGNWIRYSGGRYEWDTFAKSQRKYNSYLDQWDLWVGFAPHDEPEDTDDDDDGEDLLETHQTLGASLNELASGEISRQLFPPPIFEYGVVSFAGDCLYEDLQRRFGFVGLGAPQSVKPEAIQLKATGWFVRDLHHTVVSQDIHVFLSSLAKSMQPLPSLLASSLPAPFAFQCDTFVCHSTETRVFLLIAKPRDPAASYDLLLHSAQGVYELAHARLSDVPSAVLYLLRRGIKFNTVVRNRIRGSLKRAVYPEDSALPHGYLGYRPVGWKLTDADHAAYEGLRLTFLRSARGRAARLAGGLLSRIAMTFVEDDRILAGPSGEYSSSSDGGVCYWDGSENSWSYWDDGLTEREEDLLCGTFAIDTGNPKVAGHESAVEFNHQMMISLWPRTRALIGGKLDHSAWTPDFEAWFSGQVEKIRCRIDQKHYAHQNQHWRNNTGLNRKGSTVLSTIEQLLLHRISDH